jgi:SAM-dependent methyltransferase
MIRSDEQNLTKATSVAGVDALNGAFYGTYPYPWRPESFHFPADSGLTPRMLAQDLGDFVHDRASPRHIWVAGCGTNQAVFAALTFPDADIVGSDLSVSSLELCGKTAAAMGLSNLTLRRESIFEAQYRDEFDLVICTGVIHHTGDPPRALACLAQALRPDGVMELMVYNRFHRILTSAVQKAIQFLAGGAERAQLATEMQIADALIQTFRPPVLTAQFLSQMQGRPDSMVADTLVQPVEFSYTVETLAELASECGLEVVAPCLNEHDKAAGRLSWNLTFSEPDLARRYAALDDLARWQVTNLLMAEASPMLWFYLQPRASRFSRRTERETTDAFLDTVFRKTDARQRFWMQQPGGGYALSPRLIPYPPGRREPAVTRLYEQVDGERTMRELLGPQANDDSFCNQARLMLTTSAFPFLEATHGEWI